MTYIDYLNAFNRWLELGSLPGASQLLYYKLLDVFNRCAWAEWVSVDNLRLMSMIQVESRTTFLRYRDKLVEAGFIEVKKGKKGSPSQYRLTGFCTNFEQNMVKNLYGIRSENDTESGQKTGHINRTKTKTKTKKEPPIAPLDGFECGAQLKSALEDWLAYKQERGQGLKTLLAEVKTNAEKYGEDAVVECIRRSMSSNWQGLFFDRLSRESSKPDQPYRYNYGEMGDSL